MFFIPYKFDLGLAKVPYVTILVCLLCIGIYFQQHMNGVEFMKKSAYFCAKSRTNVERMAMEKSLGDASSGTCLDLMQELALAEDPDQIIAGYAADSTKFAAFSEADSRQFIQSFLQDEFRSYQAAVPPLKTKELWYVPESWNPVTMVTSTFSHGGWDHLIGNLIFFYAFAAAVELIIGSLAFFAVIIAMAFGTNVSYSLAMLAVQDPLPTVGLSGVVMGMIAMLAYFLPSAKIRCFYWVLIKIGTVAVSAWFLALIFIGIDFWTLLTQDDMGGINLVAHVSGAMLGFVLAIAFFRRQKRQIVID